MEKKDIWQASSPVNLAYFLTEENDRLSKW
jgi:hypothetical protein